MFESLHPDHIQLRGNQPLSGSIPLFIFSLRKSRAALSRNCALTKSLKPYYYNIPAYMVESLTKLLNSPPYSPSNDGQWLPPVRPSWRFAMKRQLRGQSYPFVTSKDMLASDMIAEDSGRLLDELNRATAELMSMDSAAFGREQWQLAHRRQQAAFAAWLLYIRKDPVFQHRSNSTPTNRSSITRH